ncbi:hypothetical protein GA0115234_106956 [Streptomyces sp. DvalAA-43]|nr:hypothetical protein GA0115234_106956 [Streptomyces sp. DvalAA-43]
MCCAGDMTTPDVTTSSAPTPHTDDAARVTELRSTLQKAGPLLAFCAGREAAVDPALADRLLAAAEEAEATLARTAMGERMGRG